MLVYMVISMLTEHEGKELVKLARLTVESYISQTDFEHEVNPIGIRAGAFVSLFTYRDVGRQELRGCIGFPYADNDLNHTIRAASIAAATCDPRFKSITIDELCGIVFEVSILTNPTEIIVDRPDDYLSTIRLGIDGLVLNSHYGSGLLLPQVPLEQEWGVEEFLTNLCRKAGAPPDIWRLTQAKLYKFQALVFRELEPSGNIIKIGLHD
jgi:uncharacterized protein (TIGR00296 family)